MKSAVNSPVFSQSQ